MPPKKKTPSEDRSGADGADAFEAITEGKATVFFRKGNVFYNKVQVQNRDLSVASLRVFWRLWKEEEIAKIAKKNKGKRDSDVRPDKRMGGSRDEYAEPPTSTSEQPQPTVSTTSEPRMTVLEALSASGLRALRYIKEVDGIECVIANDLDAKAVSAIANNVAKNDDVPPGKSVKPNHGDAATVMYMARESKQYHVIDLDPYGSPAIFIDAAVQSVAEGGVLLITCTDMAVLCGNHAEVCYTKYGGMSLRGKICHEMALRLVLGFVQLSANRYRRHIEPLVCVSMDFYVRLVVRVRTSAERVKETSTIMSHVYQCKECYTTHLCPIGKCLSKGNSIKYQPGTGPPVDRRCDECGGGFNVGGPVWTAPIYSSSFVDALKTELTTHQPDFASYKRLFGLLTALSEELDDVPFFYHLHDMSRMLHVTAPTLSEIRSALLNGGFRVSTSHTEALAIKTDAPPKVMWDIMRCFAKKNQVNMNKIKEDSPAAKILGNTIEFEADFTEHKDAGRTTSRSVPKFVPPPEKCWGPKERAKGSPWEAESTRSRKNMPSVPKADTAPSKDEAKDETKGEMEAQSPTEAQSPRPKRHKT